MKQFKIYYPCKPYYVNQKFGETAFLSYYKDNGVVFKGHNGLDLVANHGSVIRAAHDGIAYYEVDNAQGHGVVVRSNEMFEYEGEEVYFKSVYWHMIDGAKEPQYKSPVMAYRDLTKQGMQVKAGDIIGYADSTGLSTGNHLHFSIKPCLKGEPEWTLVNIEQNNGYNGAIDPVPYFNGFYAEDIHNFLTPFNNDLEYMMTNDDIRRLQTFLKELGYFPQRQECTGLYGSITRSAVYHFQLDHVNLTAWENLFIAGKKVGPKTRFALNTLIKKYQ